MSSVASPIQRSIRKHTRRLRSSESGQSTFSMQSTATSFEYKGYCRSFNSTPVRIYHDKVCRNDVTCKECGTLTVNSSPSEGPSSSSIAKELRRRRKITAKLSKYANVNNFLHNPKRKSSAVSSSSAMSSGTAASMNSPVYFKRRLASGASLWENKLADVNVHYDQSQSPLMGAFPFSEKQNLLRRNISASSLQTPKTYIPQSPGGESVEGGKKVSFSNVVDHLAAASISTSNIPERTNKSKHLFRQRSTLPILSQTSDTCNAKSCVQQLQKISSADSLLSLIHRGRGKETPNNIKTISNSSSPDVNIRKLDRNGTVNLKESTIIPPINVFSTSDTCDYTDSQVNNKSTMSNETKKSSNSASTLEVGHYYASKLSPIVELPSPLPTPNPSPCPTRYSITENSSADGRPFSTGESFLNLSNINYGRKQQLGSVTNRKLSCIAMDSGEHIRNTKNSNCNKRNSLALNLATFNNNTVKKKIRELKNMTRKSTSECKPIPATLPTIVISSYNEEDDTKNSVAEDIEADYHNISGIDPNEGFLENWRNIKMLRTSTTGQLFRQKSSESSALERNRSQSVFETPVMGNKQKIDKNTSCKWSQSIIQQKRRVFFQLNKKKDEETDGYPCKLSTIPTILVHDSDSIEKSKSSLIDPTTENLNEYEPCRKKITKDEETTVIDEHDSNADNNDTICLPTLKTKLSRSSSNSLVSHMDQSSNSNHHLQKQNSQLKIGTLVTKDHQTDPIVFQKCYSWLSLNNFEECDENMKQDTE